MQVPFSLEGPSGVLHYLRHLVEERGKAVVCIAEGAGQVKNHMASSILLAISDYNHDFASFVDGLLVIYTCLDALRYDLSRQKALPSPRDINIRHRKAVVSYRLHYHK